MLQVFNCQKKLITKLPVRDISPMTQPVKVTSVLAFSLVRVTDSETTPNAPKEFGVKDCKKLQWTKFIYGVVSTLVVLTDQLETD
jgi:hypothetical protein